MIATPAESVRSGEHAALPLTSTSPPATDDIDSEWPSDPDASNEGPVQGGSSSSGASSSLSPATDDVDSGWLSDPDSDASEPAALIQPLFPADPALPQDLAPPAAPLSSRPAPSRAPSSSREVDTIPAAPQASRPPGATSSSRVASLAAPDSSAAPSRPSAAKLAAELSAESPVSARSSRPAAEDRTSSPAGGESDPESITKSHVVAALKAGRISQPVAARGGSRAPLIVALLAGAALAIWLLRPSSSPSGVVSPDSSSGVPLASAVGAPAVVEAPPPAAAAAPTPAAVGAEEPAPAAVPSEAAPVPPVPAPDSAQATAPTPASPVASAAAEPSKAARPSAEPSDSKTAIRVVISVRPPQARIFYRGKEVGRAPVTVEIEPGKRRSFEVGAPGFMTRKVVIDGSKAEVLVGLRPTDAAAAVPAQP
jgi:hypothetical protein